MIPCICADPTRYIWPQHLYHLSHHPDCEVEIVRAIPEWIPSPARFQEIAKYFDNLAPAGARTILAKPGVYRNPRSDISDGFLINTGQLLLSCVGNYVDGVTSAKVAEIVKEVGKFFKTDCPIPVRFVDPDAEGYSWSVRSFLEIAKEACRNVTPFDEVDGGFVNTNQGAYFSSFTDRFYLRTEVAFYSVDRSGTDVLTFPSNRQFITGSTFYRLNIPNLPSRLTRED